MTMKTVGVIGSGLMGSGIAEVAARNGFEVVVRSRSRAKAEEAVSRVGQSLAKAVDKGHLDAAERDQAVDRLRATADLGDLELCDLAIETIVEDLPTKQALFRDLDRICAPGALLATNTSTLPIVEMAMATERPDRVIGLHFFNPAPRMPLVEIVPALTTSPATVSAARAFAEECGKEPVTVKDKAGFIVNALLFPYLNSAIHMLDSGVATREDIDTAMKGGCGFPMGPLEVLDLVGLDTSLAILNALDAEEPSGCTAPAPLLKRMVAARRLGRKTGEGFYSYTGR